MKSLEQIAKDLVYPDDSSDRSSAFWCAPDCERDTDLLECRIAAAIKADRVERMPTKEEIIEACDEWGFDTLDAENCIEWLKSRVLGGEQEK